MLTVGEVQGVVQTNDLCGEGAVWHPLHNAVYWTDINRGLVHRWRCIQAELTTWHFNQPATALALTLDPDVLVLVLGGRILLWNPITDDRTRLLYTLPAWPAERMNDARVAPDGRLWFNTMQNNVRPDGSTTPVTQHIGRLMSIDGAGRSQVWDDGFGIGNTLAWPPAGDHLLFGDSLTNTLYRYPFSPDGRIDPGQRAVHLPPHPRGVPDGSAMDAEGFLWHCRYDGGCVLRLAPDGSLDHVLEVPVANPTTCCFGGHDLRTLYITSAAQGLTPPGPIDGALLQVHVAVAGLASPHFASAAQRPEPR